MIFSNIKINKFYFFEKFYYDSINIWITNSNKKITINKLYENEVFLLLDIIYQQPKTPTILYLIFKILKGDSIGYIYCTGKELEFEDRRQIKFLVEI